MFNKRGFEIGITTVVLLILSLVLFIFAINMTFDWFRGAQELKGELDRQTEEQIISALSSSSLPVVIPFTVKQGNLGEPVIFGAGVRNVGDVASFSGRVSFSRSFYPDGREMCADDCREFIDTNWLGNFAVIEPFVLKRNEQKAVPILVRPSSSIRVGTSTQKGDYVFNVCVYSGGDPGCSLSAFRNSPASFYTSKMYQVTVRVI